MQIDAQPFAAGATALTGRGLSSNVSVQGESVDEREQKAISDIEKYGCHILHVLEEGEDPPFSYSVGIWKSSGAPELVVVGLKRELAHFIINEYNRRVKEGHRFQLGERASDFIEGFECQIGAVHISHYQELFGWNRWYYQGNNFEALQLIYPDTSGNWPWEAGASQWFEKWQPDLSKPMLRVAR